MDLHKFIGETRKVTENDLMQEEEEIVTNERPEVNDELVASLSTEMPDMAEMDPEELKKGLTCEMEHFDTVGGDVGVVAGLAMDNLRKYPGGYYTALGQLQTELGQAQEQGEGIATDPMATDGEAMPEPAVSTEEPTEENMTMESKVKEGMAAAGSLSKQEDMEKKEEEDLKKEQKSLDASVKK